MCQKTSNNVKRLHIIFVYTERERDKMETKDIYIHIYIYVRESEREKEKFRENEREGILHYSVKIRTLRKNDKSFVKKMRSFKSEPLSLSLSLSLFIL